jgi:hypothetical protein
MASESFPQHINIKSMDIIIPCSCQCKKSYKYDFEINNTVFISIIPGGQTCKHFWN